MFQTACFGVLQHTAEHPIGQQAHVFGEHAENQAVDEMGNKLGVVSSLPQPLGKLCELSGRFFGQRLAVLPGRRHSGSDVTHLSFCRTAASLKVLHLWPIA